MKTHNFLLSGLHDRILTYRIISFLSTNHPCPFPISHPHLTSLKRFARELSKYFGIKQRDPSSFIILLSCRVSRCHCLSCRILFEQKYWLRLRVKFEENKLSRSSVWILFINWVLSHVLTVLVVSWANKRLFLLFFIIDDQF